MRVLTLLILIFSSVNCLYVSLGQAAQASKELSEEEEIALMMEQLEQFKASWESKENLKDSADEAVPSAPSEAVLPVQPEIPAVPTIKITTPQASKPSGSVQIKTQDGRIMGAATNRLQVKPQIKLNSKKTSEPSAAIGKKSAVVPSTAESILIKGEAPAVEEAPLEVKSAAEVPAPKTAADNGDFVELPKLEDLGLNTHDLTQAVEEFEAETVRKAEVGVVETKDLVEEIQAGPPEKTAEAPSVPETTELSASAEIIEAESVQEVKTSLDEPVLTAESMAETDFDEAPLPELVVPEVVERQRLAGELEMDSAEELRASDTKEAASPDKNGEVTAAQKAPVEEDIVVIQDDAALYRAARQAAEPQSAREKIRSARAQNEPVSDVYEGSDRVVESDAAKTLGRRQGVSLPGDSRRVESKWNQARRKAAVKKEPPKPNLFAETFYLTPDQRLAYDVYDIDGFVFVKSPNPDLNTKYAVVTGFGGGAMRTRSIPDLQTLDEAKKWVSQNLKKETFEGVEIKKMNLGKEAGTKELYWVGQKAYPDFKTAQQEVAVVQAEVVLRGGNFEQLVSEAAAYSPMTDGAKGAEIKGPANFEREEELILKYLDQMDIGEKLFGPFQGDASGESFTWQSFGETTWRKTNLDSEDFKSQVGFWTNRVVFKGIRFPLNTVDPFLESTIALESNSSDFASNMRLFAGLEWRPFARNPWLFNYRPWGGFNILEWIKNYRFYVMYGERKNIKDPIVGSKDEDLIAGVQIFYEWGVELPPLDQPEPEDFSDFLEHYFWGEYFGNYRWERTNFGSENNYRGWLLNSSITLGVKIPGIPLPENPINDELALMPYMRFEHVNSTEYSFPFQNQYFVAAGMRWMPFRNYRFKENEWLSKTKIFGEYVGVGLAQHAKQDGEAPNAVRWDLRFGLSFSSRRY